MSNQLAPSLRHVTEESLRHCPRMPSFLLHHQEPPLLEAHQSWQRKLRRQRRAQLAATERGLRATERGLRATERGLRATGRQIWKLFSLVSWTVADTTATSPPLPGNSALPAKVSSEYRYCDSKVILSILCYFMVHSIILS